MNWDAVLDPLFFTPFVTGLLFAAVLPVLGMYLRLREEWLAALSFAQLAAAGSLVFAVLDWPVLAGGLVTAGTAAALAQHAGMRVRDLDVSVLQARLEAGGTWLG